MPSYVFPGYPVFVDSAAVELGCPAASSGARRIVPLSALANLCAQAARSDPSSAVGILAKAAEFRDQLAVALRAAELILADVEAHLDRPAAAPRHEVPTAKLPVEPRRSRKGPPNSRESS